MSYELGVIGAGKMGGALIRALIGRKVLAAETIIAADALPSVRQALQRDCPGLTVASEPLEAAQRAQVLLIAVKPQQFGEALGPVVALRPPEQLVVSVMAGVRMNAICELLGEDTPVIRVMPNVACQVMEGAFGYSCNARVSPEQASKVAGWLDAIGLAERVEEDLLDAVTGLSGSGPAFVAVFLEALADGGVAAGLRREVAQRLAAQTVLGAGKWVREIGGPAALKDAVCSPGGTTAAGLRELEAGGLRSAAIEAVIAAAERARELG